ncbi:uncharacterized protein LOC115686212 [Syzygium oleosum]|uniref:uncharacterized protein LOC115686212 n=1 Tax=Syzygium oleosum TaxID=219896 RepID=UPI0011D27D46|nr:uncharacterized protein LOC115686212 [Syzygium oleosum]
MSDLEQKAPRRRVSLRQISARERAPEDPRLDRILQALETLVGQQAQNQAAADAVPVDIPLAGNGNGNPPMHKLVDQFLKLKPPKFTGTGDLEATTLWIGELEKAFALLRCSDEDKVTLAVYQLQGNASTWWEAFYNKYFLDYAGKQKMNEFERLRQNQLSVDQYEAKFVELSKYALRLVEDPVDKTMRFGNGLKPEIKDQLVPLSMKDYDELYERA